MQARCFCPIHGKLDFDCIIIKNGAPTCVKCGAALDFGRVLPRTVESSTGKSAKTKKKQKR